MQPARLDGSAKIRGHHRGVEVEWTAVRFAEMIRRPVEDAVAGGRSPEEAWRRICSAYRVAAAFEASARAVFESVVLDQSARSAPPVSAPGARPARFVRQAAAESAPLRAFTRF